MKKYLIIALASLALLSACRESEDAITPSGNYSPIRGGFPQGDSKYDSIINDIKNEFGVYLLYKDVTEADLNREWVSTGTGDIYVAGSEEERDAPSWNLPGKLRQAIPFPAVIRRYRPDCSAALPG